MSHEKKSKKKGPKNPQKIVERLSILTEGKTEEGKFGSSQYTCIETLILNDRQTIAYNNEGFIHFRDVETGQRSIKQPINVGNDVSELLYFPRKNERVLLFIASQGLGIVDVTEGAKLINEKCCDGVASSGGGYKVLQIVDDNTIAFVPTTKNYVSFFDYEGMQIIKKVMVNSSCYIYSIYYWPSKKVVIAGGQNDNDNLRVKAVDMEKVVKRFESGDSNGSIYSFASIEPDTLISGDIHGEIFFYSYETEKIIKKVLDHSHSVESILICRKHMISGSCDGTLKAFDYSLDKDCLVQEMKEGEGIHQLKWSVDKFWVVGKEVGMRSDFEYVLALVSTEKSYDVRKYRNCFGGMKNKKLIMEDLHERMEFYVENFSNFVIKLKISDIECNKVLFM